MPLVGRFGSLAGLGSLILPGGAFESIATVTVGSGGASSIEFTSIPGGFQHLQIRMIGRTTNSGSTRHRLRINGDTTSSSYSAHLLEGEGVAASASGAANFGKAIGSGVSSSTDTANVFVASVIDILDYASTSKNKTVRAISGSDTNGAGTIGIWSSGWFSTSAVTSLLLYWDSGNFAQHSTAALYGLRAP